MPLPRTWEVLLPYGGDVSTLRETAEVPVERPPVENEIGPVPAGLTGTIEVELANGTDEVVLVLELLRMLPETTVRDRAGPVLETAGVGGTLFDSVKIGVNEIVGVVVKPLEEEAGDGGKNEKP